MTAEVRVSMTATTYCEVGRVQPTSSTAFLSQLDHIPMTTTSALQMINSLLDSSNWCQALIKMVNSHVSHAQTVNRFPLIFRLIVTSCTTPSNVTVLSPKAPFRFHATALLWRLLRGRGSIAAVPLHLSVMAALVSKSFVSFTLAISFVGLLSILIEASCEVVWIWAARRRFRRNLSRLEHGLRMLVLFRIAGTVLNELEISPANPASLASTRSAPVSSRTLVKFAADVRKRAVQVALEKSATQLTSHMKMEDPHCDRTVRENVELACSCAAAYSIDAARSLSDNYQVRRPLLMATSLDSKMPSMSDSLVNSIREHVMFAVDDNALRHLCVSSGPTSPYGSEGTFSGISRRMMVQLLTEMRDALLQHEQPAAVDSGAAAQDVTVNFAYKLACMVDLFVSCSRHGTEPKESTEAVVLSRSPPADVLTSLVKDEDHVELSRPVPPATTPFDGCEQGEAEPLFPSPVAIRSMDDDRQSFLSARRIPLPVLGRPGGLVVDVLTS